MVNIKQSWGMITYDNQHNNRGNKQVNDGQTAVEIPTINCCWYFIDAPVGVAQPAAAAAVATGGDTLRCSRCRELAWGMLGVVACLVRYVNVWHGFCWLMVYITFVWWALIWNFMGYVCFFRSVRHLQFSVFGVNCLTGVVGGVNLAWNIGLVRLI